MRIVSEGPLVHVMSFEIFVLYIVQTSCTSGACRTMNPVLTVARQRLNAKVALLKGARKELVAEGDPFVFFDFGRRRYSGAWHEEVGADLCT